MQSKMPERHCRVILVNGASGILGRQVVARAAGIKVVRATRHRGGVDAETIYVDSDGKASLDDLAGIDVVINCAGAVRASEATVRQANVTHVANLAATSKTAGVKAFIQVSSFSVYGDVDEITSETHPAPRTIYGQTKYEAEKLLGHLTSPSFRTTSVRLPFMFDAENPGLLRSLIQAFRLLPVFPLSQPETLRSMITYPDAADALLAVATSDISGSVSAADPTPFSFSTLAQIMRRGGKSPPAFFGLPVMGKKLAFRLAPPIANRILKSNLLLNDANWLGEQTMQTGLEAEITKMLRV